MEKWSYYVLVMVILGVMALTVSADTYYTLGNTNVGGSGQNGQGATWLYSMSLSQSSQDMICYQASFYCSGTSGNTARFTVGLYNASNIAGATQKLMSNPDSLNATCPTATAGKAWTNISFSSNVSVKQGYNYSLIIRETSDTASAINWVYGSGGATTKYATGAFPDPWTSTADYGDANVSVYVSCYVAPTGAHIVNTNPPTLSYVVSGTNIEFNATLTNTSDTKFDKIQLWADNVLLNQSTADYSLTGKLNTLAYRFIDVGTHNWTFFANLTNGTGYWSESGNWTLYTSQYDNTAWQDKPANNNVTSTASINLVCNASTTGQYNLYNITTYVWNSTGDRIYPFANFTENVSSIPLTLPNAGYSVLPGVNRWANPTRVTADDGSYATCQNATNGYRNCYTLNATYAQAIPASATINGLTLYSKVYASASSTTNNCTTVTVQLMKAGVAAGSNYATPSTRWPVAASVANQTFGGPTDLWGTTWTPAEINNGEFGVLFQPRTGRASGTVTCYLDSLILAINYTVPVTRFNDSVSVSGIFNQSIIPVTLPAQSVYNWSCSSFDTGGSTRYSLTNSTLTYSSGAFQCGFTDPGDWVYSDAGECVVTDAYTKTSGNLLITNGGTLIFDNTLLKLPSGGKSIVYHGKLLIRNGGKICGSSCG